MYKIQQSVLPEGTRFKYTFGKKRIYKYIYFNGIGCLNKELVLQKSLTYKRPKQVKGKAVRQVATNIDEQFGT